MVPYSKLDANAAVAMAFHQRGISSMGYVIAAGAVMGMMGELSVMLETLSLSDSSLA